MGGHAVVTGGVCGTAPDGLARNCRAALHAYLGMPLFRFINASLRRHSILLWVPFLPSAFCNPQTGWLLHVPGQSFFIALDGSSRL